jgi:hypothetical protein
MAARAKAYFEPTVDRNLRLLLLSLATYVLSACPVPRISSSLKPLINGPLSSLPVRFSSLLAFAFSALNLDNVRPTAGGILRQMQAEPTVSASHWRSVALAACQCTVPLKSRLAQVRGRGLLPLCGQLDLPSAAGPVRHGPPPVSVSRVYSWPLTSTSLLLPAPARFPSSCPTPPPPHPHPTPTARPGPVT